MGDRPAPRATSTYRGLRVTLTQAPDSDRCLVTIATKGTDTRWDEWNLLFPAIRLEAGPLNSVDDVTERLLDAIEAVRYRLSRDFDAPG